MGIAVKLNLSCILYAPIIQIYTTLTKEWYLKLDVAQKEAIFKHEIALGSMGKSFCGITFGVLQWTLYSMLYYFGEKQMFIKGMTKALVQETTLQENQIRQKK